MKKMLRLLRRKLFSSLTTQFSYEFNCLKKDILEETRLQNGVRINSVAQKQLFHFYKSVLEQGQNIDLSTTGFRNYSQFEEDGLLLFILAAIGIKSRSFVDIGSANGINSNCANLALNFGFHGLFIDGDADLINEGRNYYKTHPDTWLYPPKFECAKVTRENINSLIKANGIGGVVDLLSIDIDGNDYWIWDALETVDPRVVIIETHIEYGMRSVVVPYDKNYSFSDSDHKPHGASAPAMVKLAKSKGYRLIGANKFGFNLIFVRDDEGIHQLPAIDLIDITTHPRYSERLYEQKSIDEWIDLGFLSSLD